MRLITNATEANITDNTPAPAPAASVSAPEHQPGRPNGFGIASLVLGIVTVAGFAIPILNVATIVTGVSGIALGIVGLVVALRPRRAAIAGVILSGLGLILSIVLVVVYAAAFAAAAKSLEGATVEPADPSVSATAGPNATESFKDAVLTTSNFTITITDHRVIPVGQPGNEYGEKPVIAFYYSTTNLTDKQTSPLSAWAVVMKVVQDNDPNAENTLDVGLTPGDEFLEAQSQNIKAGGTVASAIAYQLDDLTTPVDLIAATGLGIKPLGTITYRLQ